ncbi:esterase/lipase family protein [Sulfuriroseicoccus oceanibius]|uniref:Alpha/beta fold hydrolase n=1 Tax=Sulfuriroseicoccus oceanibius TaxID=2707525 RepID=A0A6B3L814_9BACT|nr:alpha/beta fold hydrolase [Sulfuriroseicoccus oceanibius]QQL45263.1 alpha/beta fold hydrolase [Sulfuriroseicoccus oceanibius]
MRISFRSIQLTAMAVVVAFGLTACHSIVKVKERAPVFSRQLNETVEKGEAASWQARFDAARRVEKRQPHVALGEYLAICRDAAEAFGQTPYDEVRRSAYNFAVGRVIELVEAHDITPWDEPVRVGGLRDDFVLTTAPNVANGHDPAKFKLVPTDRLTISGQYFYERTLMPGVGAPVVVIADEDVELDEFEMKRGYAPATAYISFDGSTATLGFVNPFERVNVEVSGYTVPIAADLTAPLAYGIAKEQPQKLGLARLLKPASYEDTTRLIRLQPYDKERIPVLFVHGLKDTPTSWAPMINHLHGIPEIRTRFQFWAFSYPSGYPYPYSAALLREALDRINETYPGHKRIIVVGHSMGGVIARTLVTDPGDKLWRMYFGAGPDEVDLQERNREIIEEVLLFKSRDDVARVVFLASPHKGSKFASNWVGRFGSRLIKLPSFLDDLRLSVINAVTLSGNAIRMETMPNSIDTLSPRNRFVRTINELPLREDIPFHSIIGDRGKGDTPDSSDGVVEYWSSHLDGAASERIVPSNHSVQLSPDGIREVARILLLHRKELQSGGQ